MTKADAIEMGRNWFRRRGWEPFDYQVEVWKAYLDGYNGLVNAPTGTGKTYSLGMGIILEALMEEKEKGAAQGLTAVWISPIRALSLEIKNAIQQACDEMGLKWEVAVRTGDTPVSEREKQKRHMPRFLITTPESLHLILAAKGHQKILSGIKCIVADEWHDLLGTKRAVQLELALSRIKKLSPALRIWGISATIGNLKEGLEVLLGHGLSAPGKIIRGNIEKKIDVKTLVPDAIERYPWAGHLGIRMLDKVVPIIMESKTTLLFTNTRSQSEIWYQRILEHSPELAGLMALHHGSISREIRNWVEEALHDQRLKLVVCTSSLDLGVDFHPVETIIQVGSPKGVARFIQRAGRSGHRPGYTSRIYFVPTHSLELVEAAALRQGILENKVESRQPFVRSFDVLVQYLITLAVSDGFDPEEIFPEVKSTYSYSSMTNDEWNWILNFIATGGDSLHAYEEYQKVEVINGIYKIKNNRFAMRHRLSIGTIVGDNILQVKYLSGTLIGTIEESFISQLNPGDVFWFAGRSLEFVSVNGLQAFVRRTRVRSGKVPSWMGGRIPLSSQMSELLRLNINKALKKDCDLEELVAVKPLIEKQKQVSHVPGPGEFLIERLESPEGMHIFMYPFEGRFVHEGIASLVAYRIAMIKPISFSIALNDYGFELLSDQEIPIKEALEVDLFTEERLFEHLQLSLNANEMARARFRDIAAISGLTFKGYPGNFVPERHLRSSSRLFFNMFMNYDPQNLLFRQAYQEVMEFQLQEARMRAAFKRISSQKIILKDIILASPFSFPIMVDGLREKLSSEKFEDRIKRMKLQLED